MQSNKKRCEQCQRFLPKSGVCRRCPKENGIKNVPVAQAALVATPLPAPSVVVQRQVKAVHAAYGNFSRKVDTITPIGSDEALQPRRSRIVNALNDAEQGRGGDPAARQRTENRFGKVSWAT